MEIASPIERRIIKAYQDLFIILRGATGEFPTPQTREAQYHEINRLAPVDGPFEKYALTPNLSLVLEAATQPYLDIRKNLRLDCWMVSGDQRQKLPYKAITLENLVLVLDTVRYFTGRYIQHQNSSWLTQIGVKGSIAKQDRFLNQVYALGKQLTADLSIMNQATPPWIAQATHLLQQAYPHPACVSVEDAIQYVNHVLTRSVYPLPLGGVCFTVNNPPTQVIVGFTGYGSYATPAVIYINK